MTRKTKDEDRPARRERGAITVYAAMREDILTMRLEPGSGVDEVAIAEQFALSRTPVREALAMLAGEGLVKVLHNRSTIIAPLTMANMNDYLDTLLLLTRAAYVTAAKRCTHAALADLRDRLAAYREAIQGDKTLDIVFKQLELQKGFSQTSCNFFLQKFFPDCLDYGRRSMLVYYFPYATADDLKTSLDDYADVIDAVAAGRVDACNEIAARQLRRVIEVLQRSLEPTISDDVDINSAGLPGIQIPTGDDKEQ